MWEAEVGVMRVIFKTRISGDGIGTIKEPLQGNPESVFRGNCML